jgi:hypothetical protein
MRLISDVSNSLRALDVSRQSLRKFAFTVGGVLVLLALWLAFRQRNAWVRNITGGVGLGLLVAGAVVPQRLGALYRSWMALAFTLGWVMSRVVLTAVFALVVTPIAVLARLVGKRFLEVKADPGANSYWIRREPNRPAHYEKMY